MDKETQETEEEIAATMRASSVPRACVQCWKEAPNWRVHKPTVRGTPD